MKKPIKIKQINVAEVLGITWLIALSENGDLYQSALGSGNWEVIQKPVPFAPIVRKHVKRKKSVR